LLSTFCATCGVVNQVAEPFCVGCGANLALQPASAPPHNPAAAPTADWQPFQHPLMPLRGIGSFSIGEVFKTSLSLFFSNIWLITKIVFVVVAPFEIFKALTLVQERQDWQTTLLTLLLGAFCNVLIAPALIYALMKILETGTKPGVNESFRWGLAKIWPFALCAAAAWFLQALGYVLCFIPGIIVSLTLAVVYPIAVLENGPVEGVLKRSSALTRGYRLEILLVGIGVGLVVSAIALPFVFLMAVNSPPLGVIGGIVIDILEEAVTVLSLVLYLSLARTPRSGPIPLSTSI